MNYLWLRADITDVEYMTEKELSAICEQMDNNCLMSDENREIVDEFLMGEV